MNPELFHAALGGYGLFGVILDAQLETAPNELCRYQPYFISAEDYPERFQKRIANDPQINLAYGRLSVDRRHFLSEGSLHTYETAAPQPAILPAMSPEEWGALKNKVFRASERNNAGKRRRWLIEKEASQLSAGHFMTRNTIMSPDIHVLWPQDLRRRDILHEYFIPYEAMNDFRKDMQKLIPQYHQNLLNDTLRDVRQDNETLLAYAPSDRCAIVLFFSQEDTPEAEARMKSFTQEMIDAALREGGSFYLPYRLHYTRQQFHRAYPRFADFLKVKQKYDAQTLFTSRFYDYVTGSGT